MVLSVAAERDFQPEDFARFHPGGSLGRRLLTRVADVMNKDKLPICTPDASFKQVVHSINRGYLGLTLVMQDNVLEGIITDGDIRRAFDRDTDFTILCAQDIMSRTPKTVTPDMRFAEAEAYMRAEKVGSLVVQDDNNEVVGILRIYDMDEDQQPAI